MQVYLGGKLVAVLDRSHPKQVQLQQPESDQPATLAILVHAMGRDSGGCFFDLKGLITTVKLNGETTTLQSLKRAGFPCTASAIKGSRLPL